MDIFLFLLQVLPTETPAVWKDSWEILGPLAGTLFIFNIAQALERRSLRKYQERLVEKMMSLIAAGDTVTASLDKTLQNVVVEQQRAREEGGRGELRLIQAIGSLKEPVETLKGEISDIKQFIKNEQTTTKHPNT